MLSPVGAVASPSAATCSVDALDPDDADASAAETSLGVPDEMALGSVDVVEVEVEDTSGGAAVSGAATELVSVVPLPTTTVSVDEEAVWSPFAENHDNPFASAGGAPVSSATAVGDPSSAGSAVGVSAGALAAAAAAGSSIGVPIVSTTTGASANGSFGAAFCAGVCAAT